MGQESVSGIENLSYLNQENEIKPIEIRSQRDPTTSDRRYKRGTIWINEVEDHVFILTSIKNAVPTWTPTSSTAGAAPISEYIVASDGSADFSTIQTALDAANTAGGNATVIVRPGTYNENLTLYDTVDIQGNIYSGVTINGVHTPPASGRFTFQNVTLTSATDIFNSAVAGSTDILIEQAIISITNGYIYNLPNWTGGLFIDDCGSTSAIDGVINNTGGAPVKLTSCTIGRSSSNRR